MTYQEYKTLRAAGRISADIDNSTALRLIDRLPKQYQAAHAFWSWVWMLSIPGFICVAIFVKWWFGLILLCVATPAIFSGTKKAAAQHVLAHTEEDEEFFNQVVKDELLRFK
jgi:hypothetical protein